MRWPQQPAEVAAEAHRIGRRSSCFAPQQKRLYTTRLSSPAFKSDTDEDWVNLNFQQNFNEKIENVQIFDTSKLRVFKNILTNRLCILNSKINYKWLNLSLDSFKVKCKSQIAHCEFGKKVGNDHKKVKRLRVGS